MATTELVPLPDLPAQVARVLTDFVSAAQTAFANELRGVVLFGSAAEGRLRATSDVNLLIILSNFDEARAGELRKVDSHLKCNRSWQKTSAGVL
jgi:predicted nucleotidyltransferase